jgi:hypothetical protein
MQAFIATVRDDRLRAALQNAIERRRPFRTFKDVLLDHSGERERWFAFKRVRVRERAKDWLAAAGIALLD